MYKAEKTVQMIFRDFNQYYGMKLDCNDEWGIVARRVDWGAAEDRYMDFFLLKRGRPALDAHMALGILIIQKQMKLSDRSSGRSGVPPATGTSSGWRPTRRSAH